MPYQVIVGDTVVFESSSGEEAASEFDVACLEAERDAWVRFVWVHDDTREYLAGQCEIDGVYAD